MEDFKDRLLVETQELAKKLNMLNVFMASDKFPTLSREEKDLLYEQCICMNKYVQILGKRLEYYGEQFKHKIKFNI